MEPTQKTQEINPASGMTYRIGKYILIGDRSPYYWAWKYLPTKWKTRRWQKEQVLQLSYQTVERSNE